MTEKTRNVMWVKCCLLVLLELSPVFPGPVRGLGWSTGSRRTAMRGARFLTCNSSFELRLRGGGGVFDGQLSEAHGLGRVSETLLMRERLGSNCGDPGNVAPDITSNHHLDTLSTQQLFESIGTDDALTASGDLTSEWEEQGRNFVKAHVARGAAMVADMAGASLHLTRALHAKFDADGDGYMQRQDMEALLAATEPRTYQAEQERAPGIEKITIEVWRQILNDTGSDPAEGLGVDGLFWLYSQPGEDVRKDCWTVFGTDGMANIPFYNPLFDIFPDPNMFRATADHSHQNTSDIPASGGEALSGSDEGGPKLRRWILEEGCLPSGHDVWDDKTLEEIAPGANDASASQQGGGEGHALGGGQCWHEQDWSAVDLRLLRDFLFETSLKADVKQRPMQTVPANPPLMYTPGSLVQRPFGPVEAFGLTWNEYMGMCSLPEHIGMGGRPYVESKKEYFRTLAKNTTICSTEQKEACAQQGRTSVTGPSATGPSATGLAEEGVAEQGEGEEEEERERRGKSLEVLRKIAEHFGLANATSLSFEELSPHLDSDGEVVLPGWLSWDDLREMEGVGAWDPEVRASIFAPSLNQRGSRNMTLRAARDTVDSRTPLPFNWDGHPWVYDRPVSATGLGLSQRSDPWEATSPSIRSIVLQHQQRLGGSLERAVATGDRRKSFKVLMVGPDGGGKSSLLFCWKANQALAEAQVETVPTVYDFNVEEVVYKDVVFVCWDMGGPDDFRGFMPPTADPASVDALIFVVDACRMQTDAAYCEQARKELWRHLQGDIYSEEVLASDALLRKGLAANPGPEDEEELWEASPPAANEMLLGPVADGIDGMNISSSTDVHYLPLPTRRTLLNADGSEAKKPTDAGLWLRHVRKVLVIANKCEAAVRASLAHVTAALELERVQTTRLNSLERGGSPLVVMPHHPEVPRVWHVQAASAHEGYGVLDGLEWLYNVLEGDVVRSG